MKFIPESNSVEIGKVVETPDDALKTAAKENALESATGGNALVDAKRNI